MIQVWHTVERDRPENGCSSELAKEVEIQVKKK